MSNSDDFNDVNTLIGGKPSNVPEELNPFDPASLRLDLDYTSTTAVERVITTVKVGRPDKQVFFRVHPDAGMRLNTAVLRWTEDSQIYLVQPQLRAALPGEIDFVTLYTVIDRSGNLSLWPVKLPGEDGRINSWPESARRIAELATKSWVRAKSDMMAKAYAAERAIGSIPDPIWPDISLADLLRLAFEGRNIDREDHPILLKLKGKL